MSSFCSFVFAGAAAILDFLKRLILARGARATDDGLAAGVFGVGGGLGGLELRLRLRWFRRLALRLSGFRLLAALAFAADLRRNS